MLQSMTGFGKAICEFENKKIAIEIKSLNSKQFDLNVKMPIIYKDKELNVRNDLFQLLERGKIDLFINVENTTNDNLHCINNVAVIDYISQINEIVGGNYTANNIDLLSIIMRLPESIKSVYQEANENEWVQISICINSAVNQLIGFRKQEGNILSNDIKNRIELIKSYLDKIENFESKRIENIKTRISNNLNTFFNTEKVDKNRFEQELIYYLEKIDITEEKVRLRNHCNFFLKTLTESNSNGKKLGFISQEIGREINTLGSKANDFEIQKIVVDMKDELEKIKEQLMNVL